MGIAVVWSYGLKRSSIPSRTSGDRNDDLHKCWTRARMGNFLSSQSDLAHAALATSSLRSIVRT